MPRLKNGKCPECGNARFNRDQSHGELTCRKCGLVLEEEEAYRGPEWSAYEPGEREKKARAGPPMTPLRHDRGISTKIGMGPGDMAKLPPERRRRYYRMMKLSMQIAKSKDKTTAYALTELNRQASYLGLPMSVQERVGVLFEQVMDKKILKGKSIESVITALIYYAAKDQGIPRTLDEMAAASQIPKERLAKVYKNIARALDLKILPTMPADYLPRFASLLGLSGETQAVAKDILRKAEETNITTGKGPIGIVSAVLYIASILKKERRTQFDVAEAVGVTETTLRKRYKEILKALKIEEAIEKKARELGL